MTEKAQGFGTQGHHVVCRYKGIWVNFLCEGKVQSVRSPEWYVGQKLEEVERDLPRRMPLVGG
jgi:hypothetical protein